MSRAKKKRKMLRRIKFMKRISIKKKMGKPIFFSLCRTPRPLGNIANKYNYKATLYKVLYNNAHVTNVRWNASNITHCSFRNAKCIGVDFCNTNLKNTSFCGAVLKNVMFFNCNLKGVNFKNATFENVIFISTNLNNAKNLVIDNGCLIYNSYPQITIPDEFSTKLYNLYSIPQIKKYNVLFVKENKLNLWILKILIDMFGEDVFRVLIAIQRKKRIDDFCTLSSYVKHIEKYLQI